jgi:hypothetical protein
VETGQRSEVDPTLRKQLAAHSAHNHRSALEARRELNVRGKDPAIVAREEVESRPDRVLLIVKTSHRQRFAAGKPEVVSIDRAYGERHRKRNNVSDAFHSANIIVVS